MEYDILLDLAAELGYRLAMSGAETFRVEESICHILTAYGIESEVFVIPNCLHVSIETAEGRPMTRMRRIGHHGNDLERVERYSNLSRRICAQKPDAGELRTWLADTENACRSYRLSVYLLGTFLGAGGFAVLFGGTLIDALIAGLCGVVIGLVSRFLSSLRVNSFFATVAQAFIMALAAYGAGALHIAHSTDTVIIGALMLLVPGLLFTNAMRDIIFGDTNSGINRIVQVLLIATAIALGTGGAWSLSKLLWGAPVSTEVLSHHLLTQCIAAFISCLGFGIIFNVHGSGILLCCLGGTLSWLAYRISGMLGCGDILAYFIAGTASALYAETMARIRKYPAISYLLIAIFPLIPGAGIYYTTEHLASGDMPSFTTQGLHTAAIAGVLAVGILTVSTLVRLWGVWLQYRKSRTQSN